jgi:Family of unknown function (DUF6236)
MRPNARGVVIGSAWQCVHAISQVIPGTSPENWPRMPSQDHYAPDFSPIEPLVRRALLYFDRVVWPSNDLVEQGSVLHEDYLQKKGVLRREPIRLNPPPEAVKLLKAIREAGCLIGDRGLAFRSIAQAHVRIFRDLERAEPGRWSFATLGRGLDLPPDDLARLRGIEINLYDALPVPADGVPYEDILEFKERRRDSLIELREHTDDLYAKITSSADIPKVKNSEIEKLERSLAGIQRLMGESRFAFDRVRVGISLTLKDLADAGKQAVAAYAAGGTTLVQLAVGAASLITFEPKVIESPVKRAGPLAYVYDAAMEGIVDRGGIAPPSARGAA